MWPLLLVPALVAALAAAPPARAQEPPPAAVALDQRRLAIDRPAMWTLVGWATTNLAAGGVGWATAKDPSWRAFHQGNAAWNAVNLAIAVPSLVGMGRERPGEGGLPAALDRAHRMEVVLAVNTALDVAYLTAGAWLWERGARSGDAQSLGWGRALVLQGGFLLAFDAALLTLHRRRVTLDLQPLLARTEDGTTVGLAARF